MAVIPDFQRAAPLHPQSHGEFKLLRRLSMTNERRIGLVLCCLFLLSVVGVKGRADHSDRSSELQQTRPNYRSTATTLATALIRPELGTVTLSNVYCISDQKKLIKLSKTGAGTQVVVFQAPQATYINAVAAEGADA